MDTPTASTTFDQLAYNPQCFVLYVDPSQPPEQWENVCSPICVLAIFLALASIAINLIIVVV